MRVCNADSVFFLLYVLSNMSRLFAFCLFQIFLFRIIFFLFIFTLLIKQWHLNGMDVRAFCYEYNQEFY